MPKKNAIAVAPRGLDEVVERWMKLRHEIDRRKTELEELEPPIRYALERAPNRERKFGPHFLYLTKDTTRKNFDRKLALEVLGEEVLAPFISETDVAGSIRPK